MAKGRRHKTSEGAPHQGESQAATPDALEVTAEEVAWGANLIRRLENLSDTDMLRRSVIVATIAELLTRLPGNEADFAERLEAPGESPKEQHSELVIEGLSRSRVRYHDKKRRWWSMPARAIATDLRPLLTSQESAILERLFAAAEESTERQPKTIKDVVEARAKSRRPLPQLGTAKDVVAVLGGSKIMGTEVNSDDDLIRLNEKGLPFEAGQHLRTRLGITAAELAELTAIAPRTITRRKAGRFTAHESERLIRIARILAIALQVMENEDRAVKWLRQPNRALGGKTPLSNARLENGARQVESLLGALEHGVYR